ncbi:MAG TPA: GH116 family glycosyl-hydrolase [Fimbriimonadales bacterium]|nr:GH116 family glycosyl-hydrolase [Fimbriimonadales bacterium]
MERLTNATWLKTIWDGSDRHWYLDKERRCVAMPLGGIGTGNLSICGDGSLRQFQIANRIQHCAYLPYSFFAVGFSSDDYQPHTCILLTKEFWEQSHYENAPGISDYLIPEELIRAFEDFPTASKTRFCGEYPIAKIHFDLEEIPLRCRLTAWSPLVPFDEENSGLPVAIFEFEITNESESSGHISLLASLQNAIGWDGVSTIRGIENEGYGGNYNRLIKFPNHYAVEMLNTKLSEDHPSQGEMMLLVSGGQLSAQAQWNEMRDLWGDFATDGDLEHKATEGISEEGKTWNAALVSRKPAKPKETVRFTAMFFWRFPNRYVDFDQALSVVPRDFSRYYLGNHYCKRFGNVREVAEYVLRNLETLRSKTFQFHDTFYDSSLPYHLLDAITANLVPLRTNITFRSEDGHFYGFEGGRGAFSGGANAAGGCCPLNCTHVWNYDQTLFAFWRKLHRDMRDIDWFHNQHESGYLPHRTIVPLHLPRLWNVPIGGPTNPAIDGLFAAILKTYQHWRAFNDESWKEKTKLHVLRAIRYAMNVHDSQGDGMIRGEQPNTYDIHLYGPNTFIGTQYLAALLACEKMFEESHPDVAKECRKRFESGSRLYDETCWNGEYYRQIVEFDQYEYQYGDGCIADQLLGQWWAHICDLGYVLPKDHVRKALETIFRRNFRRDFRGIEQTPRQYALPHERGVLNATYEPGKRPKVPLLYSDEVWSGVEYALASLMIYEGMVSEGMQIVKATRDRYSGTLRNPFNEIECGDHYVRSMSIYSLLPAITGAQYSLDKGGTLKFRFSWKPGICKSFFVAGEAYGIVEANIEREKADGKIQLVEGTITVNELVFGFHENLLKKTKLPDGKVHYRSRSFPAKSTGSSWVCELGTTLEAGDVITLSENR